MRTSKQEIRTWLEEAKAAGATHMLVVDDTFDHEDYPVNVPKDKDPHEVVKKYSNMSMQKVMEVYDLSMDIEQQLSEFRAFHLPKRNQ